MGASQDGENIRNEGTSWYRGYYYHYRLFHCKGQSEGSGRRNSPSWKICVGPSVRNTKLQKHSQFTPFTILKVQRNKVGISEVRTVSSLSAPTTTPICSSNDTRLSRFF